MEAAEAAIDAAKNAKTVPMHTFSGPVEHAIAHIEEAALHDHASRSSSAGTPSRSSSATSKVLEQLNISKDVHGSHRD